MIPEAAGSQTARPLRDDPTKKGNVLTESTPFSKLSQSLKRSAFILATAWTAIIAMGIGWFLLDEYKNTLELARIQAGLSFDKDLVYRRWAAEHGGVYVPLTEESPANPYLSHIKNRDIKTMWGQDMTLVNPAYMTRQVHELGRKQYGNQSHITSLKPLRPANVPDAWEAEALRAFEHGKTEVAELSMIGGIEYFRLMRPMITEASCLKCHADQGYEKGDLRGGISVSVPMAPLRSLMNGQMAAMTMAYGFIWLLGLGGIGLGALRMKQHTRERDQAVEEMEKLALAMKHSSELVNLASLDGMMTFLNEAGARMLGIDPQEINNTNIMEVIPDHLTGLVENELLPALMRGDTWEGDLQYLNLKTGEFTDVHAMTFAIKDHHTGKAQFFANVSRDITERKRAEGDKDKLQEQLRQAQKMEAIGTLAGGVAHDFNNTLAGIMAYTELSLLQNQENTILHSNLEKVLQAAERGKALVKQILAFARPAIQEYKPLDIGLAVAETHKFLRSALPATIEIRYNLQVKSGTISADPIQIQQVLVNLCFNAAYAMRDKAGVLEINLTEENLDPKDMVTYPELKPGAYLRLTISDTGHGIDQENIDRIFDPFFTTKEAGEGAGMGLSIVHGIIKNHDGAIRVESTPGKGSTFEILLPRAKEKSPSITDIFQPVSMAEKGTRILFVDDEEDIVTTGKQMLEHFGYKVIARSSSKEALESFRAHRDEIDLVISDMTMPDMTGVDLSKELLHIRPDIPIIVCTGFSERINPKKAKEKGIREMLMKPFSANELIDTIDKVLAHE